MPIVSQGRGFIKPLMLLLGLGLSVLNQSVQAQSTYVENPKARQACETVRDYFGYEWHEFTLVDKLSDGTRVANNPAYLRRLIESISRLEPGSSMGAPEFRDPKKYHFASVGGNELRSQFISVAECFLKYAELGGVKPNTATSPKAPVGKDQRASKAGKAPNEKAAKVNPSPVGGEAGDLAQMHQEAFEKEDLWSFAAQTYPSHKNRKKLILPQHSECLRAVDIKQDSTVKTMHWYAIQNTCNLPLTVFWCDGQGCRPLSKAADIPAGGKERSWMDTRRNGALGFKGTACAQNYQGKRVYYDKKENQCWLFE
ncbi:MAG TPA: hypothetical protein VL003_03730 [Pusillimonas sp.]|uniref:hypothetical protein n=1 Tax=Pusillimonas sp. TaxID=3040095 RepID=UPI002B8E7704|nr:hypothetical protein [Pusillimonas sp.]HUH87143.1 hypothetical protein [Pusillimonas sp.]